MCSIIGVEERLHKVLGQIDLGTLDSGERSLPFGLLVVCYCANHKRLSLYDIRSNKSIISHYSRYGLNPITLMLPVN